MTCRRNHPLGNLAAVTAYASTVDVDVLLFVRYVE